MVRHWLTQIRVESTHRGRCWFGVPTIAVDIQLFLFIGGIGLCIHVAFQLRARRPSSSSDVVVSFGVHLAQPVGEWTRGRVGASADLGEAASHS
ncbi:hypothetical protein M9434_004791 [Picochlorum sp. BPE23]|nr:hypothetical protein M9435_002877 [Picochlorum sp. BPE23]KAI8111218.1 hypothetical protein M9434_004791 [Picochlorum sp. BPE23]